MTAFSTSSSSVSPLQRLSHCLRCLSSSSAAPPRAREYRAPPIVESEEEFDRFPRPYGYISSETEPEDDEEEMWEVPEPADSFSMTLTLGSHRVTNNLENETKKVCSMELELLFAECLDKDEVDVGNPQDLHEMLRLLESKIRVVDWRIEDIQNTPTTSHVGAKETENEPYHGKGKQPLYPF